MRNHASPVFCDRHLGPRSKDIQAMLEVLGLETLDQLIDETVPSSIRTKTELTLPEPVTEAEVLELARAMARLNRVGRSFIGMGYYGCHLPPAIQRNILENPGWYTQYTPYQAEISQGRLEALINFQTMVCDLTAMDLANASLLDEGTAAAEAMTVCHAARGDQARNRFFAADDCHPQTIDVVATRAAGLGFDLVIGPAADFTPDEQYFGVLVQYPATDGSLTDYAQLTRSVHESGGLMVVATDLLALTLLVPPGEWGADVVLGNSQRFGVPLGFGGPHAAFFATRDEFKRLIPGRIVGVTRDATGLPAFRLALQTREQHIRRERATSNICTAQVLLAILSSMYAVYHGPEGLQAIAQRVATLTGTLAAVLRERGLRLYHQEFFDTLRVLPDAVDTVRQRAEEKGVHLRYFDDGSVGISLDETVSSAEVSQLAEVMTGLAGDPVGDASDGVPRELCRTTPFLEHPVFHRYRSETELLRYIQKLQARDLSLTRSMIPLGSCTMKLNAAAEMMPISWPEWNGLHPFVPLSQAKGYLQLFEELEGFLSEITGLTAVSLQPNSGAQGEYAGLRTIAAYHRSRGDQNRNVCLIPQSAHGTNPASAVMAGMKVVVVRCRENGDIDIDHLREMADRHRDELGALMVTYPSTHGVFEEGILEICRIVHDAGGQVYMDGANMNALVGICRPGDFGVDVCHLNLHKTFCIPHGGGGPGVGPIAVGEHLEPFLPGHAFHPAGTGSGAVASAPWGSASILPISWAYIRLMGVEGLRKATQVAILNANYIARRLNHLYPVLYRGASGRVAHECILDCRSFKKTVGITVADIAKRLMDYGFHAPTVSWPVVETIMVEPTESESKEELDRFCEAMISIHREIEEIEQSIADPEDNVLRQAPHTAERVTADDWPHSYSREKAAFPLPWLRQNKFWTVCSRVDDTYGDRHLFCACPPVQGSSEE